MATRTGAKEKRLLTGLWPVLMIFVSLADGLAQPVQPRNAPAQEPTAPASPPQPAAAQLTLTLEQANERNPTDRTLVHEGRQVLVQGQVVDRAVRFEEYAHLPLLDSNGWSLTVEAPEFMLDRIAPGEFVEVRGILSHRNGLPVVRPVQLTTTRHAAPPKIERMPMGLLESDRALGRVVEVLGRVVTLGEDPAGQYILLENGMRRTYPVYLPRPAGTTGGLNRFRVGDHVQATGMVSVLMQDPSSPPVYRMVLNQPSAVVLVERQWIISPQTLLGTVAAILLATLLWLRHRRLKGRSRRAVRRMHGLCEEILAAGSMEELARKLRSITPRALGMSSVRIYRYDRGSETLVRLASPAEGPVEVVRLDEDAGTIEAAVALCYRNRTPLYVPRTAKSSLLFRERPGSLPYSLALLPMFAKEELAGVLRIESAEKQIPFSDEELGVLQHVANQFALMLKILDQQIRREQLARSEKLAVTGQLISGVAGELKAPLESIFSLSHRMLDAGEGEARAILMESLKVSSILSRLSHVVGPQQGEAGTIEVNQALQQVLESFDKEQRTFDIEMETRLAREPLWTVGIASQLEDVLGNLVLLASQAAGQSQEPRVVIETEGNSRRVQVAIRYGTLVYDEVFPPMPSRPGQREALGFSLCRGILHSLGGDVRIHRAGETSCRMEIELPAVFPVQRPAEVPSRSNRTESLTALLLEPDPAAQRRLVSFLATRSHRAIPVTSEGEALELLRRLRIDVIFCAVRTGPGPVSGNWADFFDRTRNMARVFVLLSDGIDTEASTLFPNGEGFVIHKPLETGELERLLDRMDAKHEARSAAPLETSARVAT
ncbi:MAG: GAF domain-containing protein [Bryobacterales bacterium]|nr:GAF domain-containing protein [Bryobacterales bacterium]